MGLKILHTADWHMDSPFAQFTPEQQDFLMRQQRKIPGMIAELVRRENCDLVLISGDVFDSATSRKCVGIVREALKECGVPVMIAPGNHDYITTGSPWLEEGWPENVHIFTEGLSSIALPQLNCRIYGAGYRSAECLGLLENFRAEGLERYQLAVLHSDPMRMHSPYCPVTAAQVRDAAFSIGCEDVLREAYTYLIAHQESQPLRGFTAIRRTYDSETELLETVAQGLTAMMARHGQYRAFVNAMRHYIDEHYSDANLSLQYLADNVIHMRADYIGREFTKDTGMKISDYLCRVRMEHAKTLLLDASSENHVYEIAEKIGLGHNPQYFSRLFRKYTGVTPKEFIQNHKK
jgi:AraC-like DNA-binding protein